MKKIFAFLSVIVLFSITSASAQDNEHPLVNMLSYVPDMPTITDEVMLYANYDAMLAPYLTIKEIDFAALSVEEQLNIRRDAMFNRTQSGYLMESHEEMTALDGIVWQHVQVSLVYNSGLTITGKFDPPAVIQAQEARGYVQQTIAGIPVLCINATCTDDVEQNLTDAIPGDLFGGAFRDHVAVQPDVIVSSHAIETLRAGLEGHAGGTGTLVQNPEFRALADALTTDAPGELLQVRFIEKSWLELTLRDRITADMPEETVRIVFWHYVGDAVLRSFAAEVERYSILPEYQQLVFADYFNGESDVAVIALVYPNVDQAEIAAGELRDRLENFHNVLFPAAQNRTFAELYSAEPVQSRVYTDSQTEVSVALVEIAYPFPSGRRSSQTTGKLFDDLYNFILNIAFYPLWYIEGVPDWMKD